jgi:hypothetical protein
MEGNLEKLIERPSTQTWSTKEDYGHGIFVYHDVVPKSLNIIERLEDVLGRGTQYGWQPAYVGYQQLMPEYRDCVDFKYKKTDLNIDSSQEYKDLAGIWDDCYNTQRPAVLDYCSRFNIYDLRYWEAFNFVRYTEGQHFQYHHDHGFSYNCTVSLVTYLNDDYEGGGLHFREQNILYTPKAGDTVIFPSNYMYPHRAMPVTKGTKYSLVTMLDYSDKYHKPKFYQETGS